MSDEESKRSAARVSPGRRPVLALLGGVAASQFGPHRAHAAEQVKVGYLGVNAMTSVYVPGIEPWKKADLDVQFSRFQGGPTIVQAIQAGGLNGGELAASVMIGLAARGLPLICLLTCNYATAANPYNRIMVAKESPLRSLADLAGKTIGVLALGTLDHVQLLALLKKANIESNRVRIITVPVPNQAQALASGQVDAMMMPPPADSIAEQQFGARMLVDATEGLPYYPVEVLVVATDWAEKHPDSVRELVRGWLSANRWIDANQEKAREVAAKALGISPDLAKAMRLPRWSRNGLPIMPGMWNLYNSMISNKLIDPSPDPAAMMSRCFIEPARKYLIPTLEKMGRMEERDIERLRSLPLPYLPEGPQKYLAYWEKA